jgi:hypothetical protein
MKVKTKQRPLLPGTLLAKKGAICDVFIGYHVHTFLSLFNYLDILIVFICKAPYVCKILAT